MKVRRSFWVVVAAWGMLAGCAEESAPVAAHGATDGAADARSVAAGSEAEAAADDRMRDAEDASGQEAGVAAAAAVTPLADGNEECCTQVGKKDECWWEDAQKDGITCTKATEVQDCLSNECYVEPGAIRGVCTCTNQSQCNDGGTRQGVCTENVVAAAGSRLCGPSYCNGYFKCACYGGCEWWYPSDETYTPAMDADNQYGAPYPAGDGNYCCEGTYPEGGDDLVAFYSNVDNCQGGTGTVVAACTADGDCDDGRECTVDSCVAGECQHVSQTGATCGIGALACSEGVCNAYGVCETIHYPAGTACGDDHSTDPCWDADVCDGAGNCTTDNYVAAGTPCGNDHSADECWNADVCDGAGTCDTDNYVADGTPCGSSNAGNECLNQDICQSGFCVNDPVPHGTPCTLDPLVYPPMCFEGYCGLMPAGPDNGVCQAVSIPAANDTCATATDLGHFAVGDTGVLGGGAVTGSLACATNDYAAGGEDCREWATGNPLGYDTKDVVYRFTYDTPDTTTETTHQQYAFVIRLESDVAATVYTATPADDQCPAAGVVDSNRCISQHKGDDAGNFYVWEHLANTDGNSWDNPALHPSQACSSTPGTGYWWCDRGGWTYPPDIAPCEGGTCTTTTGYPAQYLSQAVVFPRGDETGGTHTVYVFVDGAGTAGGAHDGGNFSLTVEKVALNNGPCERINDDLRVVDITNVEPGGSYYLGNFVDVANSDHEKIADRACGGFDCAGAWTGLTADHDPGATAANAFWPNAVHYKIHRPVGSGSQQYCVRTAPANTGNTETVLELRAMADPHDICGSDYTSLDSAYGTNGISFTASEGVLYEILVSEYYERTTPCQAGDNDCNFKLIVEEGPCPPRTAITTDLDCVAKPAIPNACTVLGQSNLPPAGQIFASDGDGQYTGLITDVCNNLVDITSSNWPGMDGPDTIVLLTNDTAVAKQVTVEFWDHAMCNTSYCAGPADLYSAIYTCDGALVDWVQRGPAGSGKAVAPDTCVPSAVYHTTHTIVIPPNTTYQFVGTAWALQPTSTACNFVWDGPNGMGYHLDVSWSDTTYTNPGQGVCATGGYEFPAGSGICWYKGSPSVSCDTVCQGYDACNLSALQTYGQDTTACGTIIDNLWGITTGGVTAVNVEGSGVSCVIRNYNTGGDSYHVDIDAPSCSAAATNITRACPCTAATGAVECTPGQTRCNGNVFQDCDVTGHWVDNTTCPFGCNDTSGCYGECLPGAVRCRDTTTRQVCQLDYTWGGDTACPYYCDDGGTEDCAGECNPGDTRCNGNVFQTCNASHSFVDGPTCTYGCDDATGCYGECTPGTTRCVDADNAQTCQTDYTWGPATFCPAGCDQGGTENCNANCPGGGVFLLGYCWYASNPGQSCTSVCSAYGGVNDATRDVAGSNGTDANCAAVLDALGYGSSHTQAGVQSWNDGSPCYFRTDGFYVRPRPNATNYNNTQASGHLACACNDGSIECTTGDTRCNGSTFQTCVAPGFWVDSQTCTYGCDDAAGCFGECTTGDRQCLDSTTVRNCVGNWWVDTACPYFCDVGGTEDCAGECNLGDRECVDGFTYHDCDVNHYWQTTTNACPYYCDQGGTEDCAGECTPGQTQCVNATDLATCNASYQWDPAVSCPFVCDSATNSCTGVCTPGTTRCNSGTFQTCDGSGNWQNTAACTYGCDNTTGCYGECTPWNTRCADAGHVEVCGAGYTWGAPTACTYYCDQGGTEDCAGECNPGDTRCNGLNFERCDAAYTWQLDTACSFVCDDVAGCLGACTPGTTACVDANFKHTCDASGSWLADEFCPAGCDQGGTEDCNPNCVGGVEVGGYCWYDSGYGGNCTNTCSTRGGVHSATATYAGHAGTDANCDAVLQALGHSRGAPVNHWNSNRGCNAQNDNWNFERGSSTDYNASDPNFARACACNDGSIECTTGDTRCNGSTFQTCIAPGFWVDSQTCSFGCDDTSGCFGVCANGATRCADPATEEVCTNYNWVSNTCAGYCDVGGSEQCEGNCNPPGATGCVSSTQSATCGMDYNWGAPTTCTYVCESATGACGGECVPGSTRCADASTEQVCGADGYWGATTACASGTCSGGACVPSCMPAGCAGASAMTIPFTFDGVGSWCRYFTSASYMNSWSTDSVKINGVPKNGYVTNFGTPCNGKYYVEYDASLGWAHVEVK